MSCETCQDCSCDNITLPIALGETGPQGPAGAVGADGADGSVLLFNNQTATTTTSTVLIDLTGMTYTIPADQLSTNGDQLRLKSYFKSISDKGSVIAVYLDGSNVLTPNMFGAIPAGPEAVSLRIESVFTRTSNTTISVEHFFVAADGTDGNMITSRQFFNESLPVTDLTGATTILKLRGHTNSLVNPLTCYFMSVEFLKKA